jgi:hypothetical protein
MMLNKNTKLDDSKQYMAISNGDGTEIIELPEGFKDFGELLTSKEYKEFANRKYSEEVKKQDEEESKLSLYDRFFKDGNGIIMSGRSGTGKSLMYGYVSDFVRDWNIKKRKEKINKLLNK